MKLLDLTMAWVRASSPLVKVQENFRQFLLQAIERGVGCTFLVGTELTNSGRPFLVSCFRGELFVFELTPQQASRVKLQDNTLVFAEGKTPQTHQPVIDPPIALTHVEVDHAAALKRTQSTTGTLAFQASRPLLLPVTIRVSCDPPGRKNVTFFHQLQLLPYPKGQFQFSLPALGDLPDEEGTPFTGVVPLFFQVCTSSELPGLTGFHPPSQPSPVPAQPPCSRPLVHPQNPNVPCSPSEWMSPLEPASSPYPPSYDPGVKSSPEAIHERPISDVVAVLVEIV